MLNLIARLANRWAWPVVAAGVVLAGLAGLFGASVARSLTGGNPDFVTHGSQSAQADERIADATGLVPDGGVIALVRTDSLIDIPASRDKIARVAEIIAANPRFAQVRTYHQTQDPALVSTDRRSTYVVGLWRAGPDTDYKDDVERLDEQLRDVPGVSLGGSEVVGAQVVSTVQHDLARAELLAFPLLFILSLWIFRSLVASALPLVIGGLNVVLTLFGLRVVNSVTDMSIFALNLVTALGLGLAIDYSLLVVSRFRSELAAGRSVPDAITVTMHTAGRTILFSSLTVSAAMASLFIFPQRFLFSMAVGGVLVSVFAAVVALLILPAMLRLLGRHVDFGSPPRWRRTLEQPESTSGGWFTLARGVTRRPGLVAVAAGALMVVLGLPFLGATFTAVGPKDLPASATSRQVDEVLSREFPTNPRESIQLVVEAPAARADAVADYRDKITTLPDVAVASEARELGEGTWLIQLDPREAGMSASSQELVKQIRAMPAPGPVLVGGETAGFVDLKASLTAHLPAALLIVSLTSVVLLALMTGSAVLPFKAVVMNLLTLSATYGILVAIFQHGHLESVLGYTSQGALDATQPILLFALVFGLSTDYGVFLLARIKEARDAGAGERESVILGVGRTGRIVSAAALLFCVALGALATSSIVFIKELGLGTALGVLIDATIVRSLLVPSLMVLLGRWNWWAPRPLLVLHDRFALREGPPPTTPVQVSQQRSEPHPSMSRQP